VLGPVWQKVNAGVTGASVAAGLFPPIKPLMAGIKVRDTVVTLGGDGNYYLTGSTGDDIWDHNDGVELWRSPDLQHWDYMGLVWSFEKDATWEKNWRFHHKPVRALWAPEIHFIKSKNNYFITHSMPPGNRGILKSATGKPEGPYVNALANDGYFAGGIDGTLFEDDDGTVYYTSGGGGTINKMKDDMSGFDGDPIKVRIEGWTGGPAREGASLFKANGRYYIGGASDTRNSFDGRYSSVLAISDHGIAGPYRDRHEAVPCGGGGDYFQAKNGDWFCAVFGNDNSAPFREFPAIVKIAFGSDGKVSIAKDQPDFLLQEGAPEKWSVIKPPPLPAASEAARP
jgi:beta-xylosidase